MTFRESVNTCVLVWLGLLALLAATVAVSTVDLGWLNAALNVAIAAAKAVVIAAWFMHLRERSGLVRLAAVVGVVWLSLLLGLTLADYLTRADFLYERYPDLGTDARAEGELDGA